MSFDCPYCGYPINKEFYLPPMSLRKRRIFAAVAEAGENGIPLAKLLQRMYAEQEPTPSAPGVLRVQVCELNRILHTFQRQIQGRNKVYYLIKRG